MSVSRPLLHGPLVAESFARTYLTLPADAGERDACCRAFERYCRWWSRTAAAFGPASPVRALHEVAALPLARLLGHVVDGAPARMARDRVETVLASRGDGRLGLVTMPWGQSPEVAWRAAVVLGTQTGVAWCACFTGPKLVVVDALRPYARRLVAIDLAVAASARETFAVLWALASAPALTGHGAGGRLAQIVEAAERHQLRTCTALDRGVREAHLMLRRALAHGRRGTEAGGSHPSLHEQALTVVFRLLFLFFAEARGLLPLEHPLYSTEYSLQARREELRDPRVRGWWPALRALMRMAHTGCRIRGLDVTAFNGRLFDPAHTPDAEQAVIGDAEARATLQALATTAHGAGPTRTAMPYADLDVEQLGAIYERLIDAPAETGAPAATRPATRGSTRKATSSFYTPRSLTDFVVRRTLTPLTDDVAPDAILALRVVDPAMGSGAFLVAACRHLASAYERALLAEGRARPGDISPTDRVGFRRLVASRCLYGVDLNPMAVQLARLSLWLTTLARDRPLTFLDHRLRVGDSLIGASVADLARQPPGRGGRRRPPAVLPLLASLDLAHCVGGCVGPRLTLAATPDVDVQTVERKQRLLAGLEGAGGPLARWSRAADAWCAGWFWPSSPAPSAAVLGDLVAAALTERNLPRAHHRDRLMEVVEQTAARRHFFHWQFSFPEVFADEHGAGREDAGFDAVIGNPPWDVLRAADGADRAHIRAGVRFVGESGLYVSGRDAHVNRYQLFVERAIDLLRPGGRLGLVVPWGLFADTGSAAVRARLFDRTEVDAIVWFENRRGIFPIHRSIRFTAYTARKGAPTRAVACRPAEHLPASLDAIPDAGTPADAFPLVISRTALDELGIGPLALPAVPSPAAMDLLLKLCRAHAPMNHPAGWNTRFGREFNATDDRGDLVQEGPGLPVIEGKHVTPFRVDVRAAAWRLPASAARRRPSLRLDTPRVAFRDVASPGNRLTLISAILPAGVVSTHTLFCQRSPLDEPHQQVLCALLNSLVANWFVRLWVNTHVTLALVHRLPLPKPDAQGATFQRLAALARRCRGEGPSGAAYAALQAETARVFGLNAEELDLVLESFPRLGEGLRSALRRGAVTAP